MIILRLFTALIFLLIPTAVRADPPTPVLGFTNPTKGSFDWEDAWYDNFGLIDDIANGRGTCAQRPAASTSLKTKFYVVTNCTDILCDCATTGTTECLTRVNDSGTAWDVGPCQWNEQKIYSILTYGAIPNDSNDDHVEIQLAIDACQTGIGESGIGANIVYFPAGEYRVGDTLLHKSCRWVGAGSNQGTRLLWTGTGGDTMIEKWSTAHPGSLASGGISGMTIKNATNDQVDAPGILLDFTTIAGSLDKLWKLEDMQFAWCTGNAIETNGWTNLHWMNVRWDQIGGYAIYLTPPVTQNLSTFLLDQFTYDHSITSGNAGEGFIYVDNTDANGASNLGTFAIRHGRIEVNASAPWNSPQSVLALKLTATPTGSRSLGARMQDVTYADASGMANDVLLYRDTTNATGGESLILTNVRTQNLSATFGGTWASTWGTVADLVPIPTGGIYGLVVFNTRAIEFGVPEEFTIRPSSNSDDAFHVSVFGQADNRFELRGDGRHAWGDGTNPVDLTLYRGTGGRLESNSEIFSAGGRLTANGASAPQFRISDVGAGNCQNSSCLGVVTTGNQFISGTAIGDSAFVAKTAGDFWIGTNTAGAQLARLRLLETGEFLGAQGTFGLGSALLSGAACVSADTGADRLYHDTDCDGTQDEDEEYLDYTTEGMGGGDIDAVFDCVTGNCNDIAAQAGDSLDMTSGDDSIPWLVKSDCGPETAQGKSCLDSDNNHFCIGDGTICRGPVMTRSIPFPAGALSVDGTQCSVPVERVINSGPKVWTVQCADSNGAIIYGSSPLPDGYNGSTFQFQLTAENENATPSGNMDMDFSCMCRGNGNEINSTWGTAQNAVISWSSYAQYEEAQDLTTAVTCDGPCLGSDTLYWRGVLDEPSTTTAQMGSIYFLHVLIEYERYMDD